VNRRPSIQRCAVVLGMSAGRQEHRPFRHHAVKDTIGKSNEIRPAHVFESLTVPQRTPADCPNCLLRRGDETLGHATIASSIPERRLF
jgi:hypothetical protein